MKPVTRREAIGRAATGIGGVLLGAELLAACGSSTSGTSAASGGTPKKGGTLRIARVNPGAANIDPYHVGTSCDALVPVAMHGYLAYPDPHTFQPRLQLAEEITPNAKGDVWTVRLREGVESHQGKSLAAEDLIFSVQRMLSLSGSVSGGTISFVDPKGIKKIDARTVRFTMAEPVAEFIYGFAFVTQPILPVGFNPKKPDGFGPFAFESFSPNQTLSMTRFANYWKRPAYLDGVQVSWVDDDSASTNALLSGQVDMAAVPYNLVESYKKNPALNVIVSQTGGFDVIAMRTDVPQLDLVPVRQALKLVLDREQAVKDALSGYGRVANDLFSPYDPGFDKSLPPRTQDIEQAKHLLKSVGQENLTLQLTTGDESASSDAMATIFAQNAAQAGIKVTLRKLQSGSFYLGGYLKYPFSTDTWPTAMFLPQAGLSQVKGAPFNESHWSNPRYGALYKQASSTLDDAKRTELKHEMQQLYYDEGAWMLPYFLDTAEGYAKNVQGAITSVDGYPSGFHFEDMWLD